MSVEYSMRISRLTVDKLGVKLYDKVSAVIAELIANAYDADATEVTIRAPMGQFLASRAGGDVTDKERFKIEVIDNGVGMTPQQVQDFFLVVGAERRNDVRRGDTSPNFERKVMGRKGVGKLAPFGICKTIEIISAGGDLIGNSGAESGSGGYLTSHTILDYDGIMSLGGEPDDRYKPTVGERDESYSPASGTHIILRDFNYRKVPDMDALGRQLAQRFGIPSTDWRVRLEDSTDRHSSPMTVGGFELEKMPNTELKFQPDGTVLGPGDEPDQCLTAGFQHDGVFRLVTGWMAYSKAPYRDELMAGVRIYCRGKIAAQTSIFNQKAGFTGEHNVRSYLVGELHADWLDEDEDLIQTDRRDILWSEALASDFQEWGQKVVKRIGTLSRDPMRKATLDLFFEKGDVKARILKAYPTRQQEGIRDSAENIARMFGRTMSRGEVEDIEVVDSLVELTIDIAPHFTLTTKMTEAAASADTPLSVLTSFLHTARLAELSSFGRIAKDRIEVINRLEYLKGAKDADESDLQRLITDAPWLINPEWVPVTENQTLASLRREFEKYYKDRTGQPVSLSDFQETGKRPDFVLSSQEGTVQIIEIKKPGHGFSNPEMDRIVTYHDNIDAFLQDPGNEDFRKFLRDFHITLVCDNLRLTGAQQAAFQGYRAQGKLTHLSWSTFLLKSEHVHQDFLREARRLRDAESAANRENT